MKYDEFASDELRKKYPEPYHIYYFWQSAGISEKKAKAAGWDDDFVLVVTKGDIIAVIKYMLVHMNGRKPEEVTDEYIDKYFTDFDYAFDDYFSAAFKKEAVARMKKLVSLSKKGKRRVR